MPNKRKPRPTENANGGPVPTPPPLNAHLIDEHALTLKQNTQSTAHRWWAKCSCGYISQSRASSDEAFAAAVIHVKRIRAKRLANGMPNERASIKAS